MATIYKNKPIKTRKIMKKILAVMLCLLATSAFAQGFGGGQGGQRQFNPDQMATRQADRIKEACGLNDEQYGKIKEYYKKQQEEMMKQFQQNQGQGQERPRMSREDMEKRREAQTAELKKILTEEQYAKYEEMQKQQRQRFGQGGPRGNRQGGPQGAPQNAPQNN